MSTLRLIQRHDGEKKGTSGGGMLDPGPDQAGTRHDQARRQNFLSRGAVKGK
jgi:hypothetical protein